MAGNNLKQFTKAVNDANWVLKDIEKAYGWSNQRNKAYGALTSVLHTLRDRLPPDQASNFAAQLPVLIRGVFYDGWEPAKTPAKMNRKDFINSVKERYPYKLDNGVERIISSVMQALANATTEQVIKKNVSQLPDELRQLLYIPSSSLEGITAGEAGQIMNIEEYTDDRDTTEGQLVSR